MAENDLRCMDCGTTDGSVTLTTTPDRRDYKMFARCPDCYERRLGPLSDERRHALKELADDTRQKTDAAIHQTGINEALPSVEDDW